MRYRDPCQAGFSLRGPRHGEVPQIGVRDAFRAPGFPIRAGAPKCISDPLHRSRGSRKRGDHASRSRPTQRALQRRRCVFALTALLACVPPSFAQQAPRAPQPTDVQVPVPNAPAAAAPNGPDASVPVTGAAAAIPASADDALASLAWLEGCWQGTVNQREFREQWLPLRGGLMIGAGQSVLRGRTQDYEFLRLEPKPDGVYFTQFSGDRKESSFRLASTATDDKDTIFTFANAAGAFPARLIYRRGTGGWLYETIEGTLDGGERKVIYPLRRVDCESGELIHK